MRARHYGRTHNAEPEMVGMETRAWANRWPDARVGFSNQYPSILEKQQTQRPFFPPQRFEKRRVTFKT